MKFLLNHYKQFSYLLISFLLLDTVAVTTVLLLVEGEELRSYPALWLAFLILLPLLFGLGKLLSQLFSKRFFIWSAIIYALYTGFSYLLTVTQHVNDFEFKAERVFSNHFWQFNSLPGLLLIFFQSLKNASQVSSCKLLRKTERYWKIFFSPNSSYFLL